MMDAIHSQDHRRSRPTTCPTAGEWFSRFILGAKMQMGQIRKQNEAITPEIIKGMDVVVEEMWTITQDPHDKELWEEIMVFALAGFYGSLRVEEVPLISLKGLLAFWVETAMTVSNTHIVLTLHRRFKGESGVRWHCIPIACLTRSGLQVKKWFARPMRHRAFVQGR